MRTYPFSKFSVVEKKIYVKYKLKDESINDQKIV